MYCSECGAKLDDTAKFCSKCGNKNPHIDIITPETVKPAKTPVLSKLFSAVVAVALIIFIGAAGFILIPKLLLPHADSSYSSDFDFGEDYNEESEVEEDYYLNFPVTDTPDDYSIDFNNGRVKTDLPDRDFGGFDFTIMGIGDEYNYFWSSRDIYAEEETGEPINDAVYIRNRRIENQYNLKIHGVLSGDDPIQRALVSVLAGDDAYDLFTLSLQGTSAQLASKGVLTNLYNIPFIDFSKPWWDSNAIRQLSIGGLNLKLYAATSDLLLNDKNATSVILFSKKLLMDYGLEDPFRLVKDGRWTINKMRELARITSYDLNGDGYMNTYDQFGFLTYSYMMYDNIISTGETFIAKDGNNIPYPNITEKLLQAFDKWSNIYYDYSITFDAYDFPEVNKLELFANNQGLFTYENMLAVPMLRTYDFDFGILPNPKLDETQEIYHNPVNVWGANAVSIPIIAENLARTGFILEALTAESRYTLLPAYYDIALKTKYMRDMESAEMLDIIFAEKLYDISRVYNFGEIYETVFAMEIKKKTDLSEAYENIRDWIQSDIDRFMAAYNELY